MTRLVLDDRFDAPVLDPDRWVPHHLPRWSTPELSAARDDLGPVVTPQPTRLLCTPTGPARHPRTGDVRRVRVWEEEP